MVDKHHMGAQPHQLGLQFDPIAGNTDQLYARHIGQDGPEPDEGQFAVVG